MNIDCKCGQKAHIETVETSGGINKEYVRAYCPSCGRTLDFIDANNRHYKEPYLNYFQREMLK